MKAISSMATRAVLSELLRVAAFAGFPLVDIESVGGVDAARRVAAGEEFDLVFLADNALRALAAMGHIDTDTLSPLMVSRVAVAVPSDKVVRAPAAQGIAFADAAEMRQSLLASRRIGYSTGPSGEAFLTMIAGWEMTDELAGRLVQAPPGVPVARLVADRRVDLGLQQLSELVGQPGIQLLGTLPTDCAIETVFAGAVATAATDPETANRMLEFLASDRVMPIIESHSFAAP